MKSFCASCLTMAAAAALTANARPDSDLTLVVLPRCFLFAALGLIVLSDIACVRNAAVSRVRGTVQGHCVFGLLRFHATVQETLMSIAILLESVAALMVFVGSTTIPSDGAQAGSRQSFLQALRHPAERSNADSSAGGVVLELAIIERRNDWVVGQVFKLFGYRSVKASACRIAQSIPEFAQGQPLGYSGQEAKLHGEEQVHGPAIGLD